MQVASDYKIIVFSYHRAKFIGEWTLRMLKDANLLHKTTLFLQCDEDVRDYGQAYPEVKIVRSPQGLMETANYAMNYFPAGTNVVQLHDDVRQFTRFVGKDQRPEKVENLDALFTFIFNELKRRGLHFGCPYPVNNSFHTTKNAIEQGLFFGHDPALFFRMRDKNDRVQLEIRFDQKLDFHRSVEEYKKGDTLRFSHVSVEHQGYNKQGAKGGPCGDDET